MLLETERLIIRDLQTQDASDFVEMASDGSLNDVGFDKDCSSWMSEWIVEAKGFANRDNPSVDYLAYAVALKEANAVIGSVGCSYYDDLQEIGITYFVGASYRNKGYAVEAVKAYVNYFFEHYHVLKMIATVREENVSSWKVLEKAGFGMTEKKMYMDLNDEEEKMYRFYEITRE